MDIDNTLLQSLLREQGFKDFKPLLTDTSTDRNLYGYIKDDCFHVCDEHLAEVPIDTLPNISTAQCLLVYTNDNKYVIDQPKELNEEHISSFLSRILLIDRKGCILEHNIDDINYYQSVASFLQICHRPIDIPILSNGTTYNPFKNELLIPDDTERNGYKSILFTKTEAANGVFLNGLYYPEYRYLFSSQEFHFIVRIDKESFKQILIVVSPIGETIYENSFFALWLCNNEWMVVDFHEGKSNDLSMCKLYKTILRVQDTCSQSEPIDNTYHWDPSIYLYKNITCFGDADALVIINSRYSDFSDIEYTGLITISAKGKIIFEDFGANIFHRWSHSLLFMSEDHSSYEDYSSYIMDTHGNRITPNTKDLWKVDYIVFEHKVLQPTRYNYKESAAAHHTIEEYSYYKHTTIYEKLYGVLDTRNGEVLVPPVYSNILLSDGYVKDDNGVLRHSCIAIVSIDNYYKGNKSTHKGVYVNNNLVIPIGYTNITPVKSRIFASKLSNGEIEEETMFIVTAINGKQGLYAADGNELLPTFSQLIEVYDGCLFTDGKYLDKDKNILFDTEGYNRISPHIISQDNDFKPNCICYASSEENQFVFVDTVYGHIEIFDEKRQKEEEYTTMYSRFDFEKRCFVPLYPKESWEESEENYDYDYSQQDDYDYERDTYYALGGDDYEAFRERGGSIDDMMDGMGF